MCGVPAVDILVETAPAMAIEHVTHVGNLCGVPSAKILVEKKNTGRGVNKIHPGGGAHFADFSAASTLLFN